MLGGWRDLGLVADRAASTTRQRRLGVRDRRSAHRDGGGHLIARDAGRAAVRRAAGGVVSSQTLNAVRHRAPDGRGGVATGRASALWFGLLAVVPFGLSWVIAYAGVNAGLWALAGLALLSAGLVGPVMDRDPCRTAACHGAHRSTSRATGARGS